MLRRAALVVFLLLMSGAAALFAASHFGIPLPWNMAATTPEAPPQEAKAPASQGDNAAPSSAAPEPSEKSAAAEAGKTVEDTVAALAPSTNSAEPGPGRVAIDIARISSDGTSVFAGRAEPDTYVTVLEDGKPAGTVKTDENGDFSLATEHKFASADPKLTFETSKTAPAPPEPAAPAPVAAPAAGPEAPTAASADAAAGDVMRKFEKLVADAREEATKQREAAARPAEPAPAPAPQEPAKAEAPEAGPAPDRVAAAPPPSGPDASSSGEAAASAGALAPAAPQASEPAAAPAETAPARDMQQATAHPAPETPRTEVAEAAPARVAAATAETTVIPVPIMFVYNEATLTPEGERAASLLLEYLTLKRLDAIELTGHADERGTQEYNMDLSRDRLETVSALLRRGGYSGNLKLTPKGKTEPYRGVDRTAYTGEALFQLDRRVELRITR